MPKNPKIKKVLVLGSGPLSSARPPSLTTPAPRPCRALKAGGRGVVLVNSNPPPS